jgi:hypothetical protein
MGTRESTGFSEHRLEEMKQSLSSIDINTAITKAVNRLPLYLANNVNIISFE